VGVDFVGDGDGDGFSRFEIMRSGCAQFAAVAVADKVYVYAHESDRASSISPSAA